MGGAYDTYSGEKRCIQGFDEGNLREAERLEDLDVDEWLILNGCSRSAMEGAWIGLRWLRIEAGGGLL
jgi:hypothetical protein